MKVRSGLVTRKSQGGPENVGKTTYFRLIDALLDTWAIAPAESLSVRTVVRAAGAAPSAIHYHFGNLEHLYSEASQVALTEAQAWMAARLAAIGTLGGAAVPSPVPMALQASIITATIAEWTGQQRRLAMALRHAPSAQWHAAWRAFWQQLAATLGLERYAPTLAFFAGGESARHLLVWNAPLDRALLEETVAALLGWLNDRSLGSDAVRSAHQALARVGYRGPPHGDRGETAAIAQAAATLLAEGGHAAVTFRAVADQAGVTLGKVIHLCGTKSELLDAALHRLYEREALRGDRAQFVAQTFAPEVIFDRLLRSVLSGQQPVLRAYDEIELAIYNGPEFAALRGIVRSMDDPSGSWALQQMLGGRQPPAALVAAYSAIIRGIGYAVEQADTPKDGDAGEIAVPARQALAPFLGAPA